MRVVLLPVKDPCNAKQRLATVLSLEERIALTWAMLKDVARAISGAKLPDRIVVVTNDAASIQNALGPRWEVLREGKQVSESHSVDWACSYLITQGAAVVLRLPGDIPLLRAEDVDSLLSVELTSRTALLVPSRDGLGTNALLRKPPDAFPSRFGPNSCRLHRQEACRARVVVKVIKNSRIALDIDDVADLAFFLTQDRQTFTARTIDDLRLAKKIPRVQERNHAVL
jgi:2-phospho-L-lactate guanylyltransferase